MSENESEIKNQVENKRMWGDVLPGTVFWEDAKAPENQNLLENDSRARKLKRVEEIKHWMKRAGRALQLWDYRSYPKRLKYNLYIIVKMREEDPEAEKLSALIADYKVLRDNPPSLPPVSLKERIKSRFGASSTIAIIKSEKEARKIRLKIIQIKKRLSEHETALKNEILYEELAAEMQLEVGYFGQQIVQRWSALANREEFYKDGKRHVKLVKIEECHYTPDEIQYKIKISSRSLLGAVKHHLPDRVTAWNLVKPETLAELSAACERPIGSPHTENTPETFENGAWIVVYREGLTDGLFDFVEYERVVTKYDANKRASFPIPLGVKRGRLVQWLYLSEHPHLMCNGIPGSGKTNEIRVVLTTLCEYHSPDEIRFFIVDLKRGGDFREYEKAPHLAAPIISKIEDLVEIVPRLVMLMQWRMDTFFNVNARDIDEYNGMFEDDDKRKMARVVIVIDECNSIDNLANGKKQRDPIWRGLTLIATQARAAGIHLLLGTQQSFSDSIPKSVRDNITFVLSGRQRTLAASLATFGKGIAKKLPNIHGRMWCDDGGDFFQLQTPFVSKERVFESVKISQKHGEYSPLLLPELDAEQLGEILQAPVFTYEDVARIAIEQFEGAMNYRKIYASDETPKGVSVRAISEMIGQIIERGLIEYDEIAYTIEPYRKGYRLVQMLISPNAQGGTGGDINVHIGVDIDRLPPIQEKIEEMEQVS